MSAKSILEADGKAILNYHLTRAPVIKPTPLPAPETHNAPARLASLHFPADAKVSDVLDQAEVSYPWLLQSGAKFVAKPDQLIKRRGKSGLLALNKTWPEAKAWIQERAGKEQRVETVDGVLRQFLVEPFVPHPQDTEYYININSVREVSTISYSCSFCCQKKTMGWMGAQAARSRCKTSDGDPTCNLHYRELLCSTFDVSAFHLVSCGSKALQRASPAFTCLPHEPLRTKGENPDPPPVKPPTIHLPSA